MNYLWVVIFGAGISFFNSWGIGANDCANSFATAVGSKVISLKKALVIAGIFEFLGAFLMGSHVTDTVRKKIVDIDLFTSNPYVLMLGMLSSNFAAGAWLTIATYFRYPVSTTHSIIGAIVGFSLAYGGTKAIVWNQIGYVVLSWLISPVLSGVFSSSIFYSVRRFAFRKTDPFKNTLRIFPILVFFTFVINSFFIFYKGTPQLKLDKLELWISIVISFSIGVFTAFLSWLLYVPYIKNKINNMLEFQPENSNVEDGSSNAEDRSSNAEDGSSNGEDRSSNGEDRSSNGEDGKQIELKKIRSKSKVLIIDLDNVLNNETSTDEEAHIGMTVTNNKEEIHSDTTKNTNCETSVNVNLENIESIIKKNDNIYLEDKDINENIKRLDKYKNELKRQNHEAHINTLHENAEVFDPKVEKACTWLQIITACLSSFAHGANDVANSVAPFATIYSIYLTGSISAKSDVPIWILALGGIGIILGLGTWGYKIIERIGRELTKITPSRGFVIELSDALTVLIASRTGMPVSTTHCQIGSVVGCGLLDGKRNVQWKHVKNIIISWIVTLPVTGFISAGLFSYAYYSPFSNPFCNSTYV